jgi:integrase/recombinase XerD
MLAIIDHFRKHLLNINGFAESTVTLYVANVAQFCAFAKNDLGIDPVKAGGRDLLIWIAHLKNLGCRGTRFENYHYALRSFFTFVQTAGLRPGNPAKVLPRLFCQRRNETVPVTSKQAFALLCAFERSTWAGLRNYTMVAMLWALGLRTSELTTLRVCDFEPDHGPKTGLLKVKGKNKKQRALFVVDRLFDQLIGYLAHEQSPKKKHAPMFTADTKSSAIANNTVQRIVKSTARDAGIAVPVTPRVLRHSFATEMYHQGVPLEDISIMMGHEKIAETAIYIHVADTLKKLALEQIRIAEGVLWM